MRLLELHSSGEMALTPDLRDKDLPAYAILSHTWEADNEEVSFQDLINNTGKQKSGFQKIRFCAEQASKDGLQYFWVDSCCIDKTNHTELHEAINSMFQWYQRAHRCYVYLTDVSANEDKQIHQQTDPAWERALLSSRWFTRGWTLQELLAPASVEFFSRDGRRLGDKGSLEKQIQTATGIALTALRDPAGFAQFSVEERFAWAETRQTTRGEDWAYCLLGIFGVYLPLLYGEGKENAVRRLKKEIASAIVDDNAPELRAELLGWIGGSQDTSGPISSPFPGTGEWLMNTKEYQAWESGSGPPVLWCLGAPGVGKTVLASVALESLTQSLEKQPVCLLRYFCEFANRKVQNKEAIWKTLLSQAISQAQSSTIRTVMESRGRLKSSRTPSATDLRDVLWTISQAQRVVLVFDGMDELQNARDIKAILHPFIKSNCSILVTSRDVPEIRTALSTACILEVQASSTDLSVYLTGKFEENELEDIFESSPELEMEMIEKSNGIFLLARILADHLMELATIKEMRAAIQSYPVHLNEAFESSLDRIKDQSESHTALAFRVMAWLVTAERKLKMNELIHGLAVRNSSDVINHEELISSKIILKVCGGLVTTNAQDGTVTMAHATIYEWYRSHADITQYHKDIGKSCLRYLTLRPLSSGLALTVPEIDSRIENMPFLPYAATHWREHIQDDAAETELSEDIDALLDNSMFCSAAFQLLNYRHNIRNPDLKLAAFESMSTGHSSLHVAAFWGLQRKISTLIQGGVDLNARDSQAWTPLHWACFGKRSTAVNLLILHGADLDTKDSVGWTPIYWAALHGEGNIVDSLLKNNANHMVRDVHGWTVLRWAAARNRIEVVGILLRHHSACIEKFRNISSLKTLSTQEALRYLEHHGSEEIIDALVDNQSEFTCEGLESTDLYSILSDESFNTNKLWDTGHFDPPVGNIWRTMAKGEYGVKEYMQNVTKESRYGPSWRERLLYAAIRAGELSAVKLMVELGADINHANTRSALHIAAFRRTADVAELLIDRGAKLENCDRRGLTPLQLAVMNGFEEIVKLLLLRGANPNAMYSLDLDSLHFDYPSRGQGRPALKTPLMLACGLEETQEDPNLATRIVHLLINSGADVSIRDREIGGLMAIHHAALARKPDILEAVIHAGGNPESEDLAGHTAIYYLILSDTWRYHVLRFDKKLLPGNGATCLDIMLRRCGDGIANKISKWEPPDKTSDVLSSYVVDWGAKNCTYHTPLSLTVRLGNWELFQVLYGIGARFETNSDLRREFKKAIKSLQIDAIDIMLEHGAVLNNDIVGWLDSMELWHSSEGMASDEVERFVTVLNKLKPYNLEIDRTVSDRNTLLQQAMIKLNSFEVTRALLENGANPFLISSEGLDSFLLATVYGHYESLRCLFQHSQVPYPHDHWMHHINTNEFLEVSEMILRVARAIRKAGVMNHRYELPLEGKYLIMSRTGDVMEDYRSDHLATLLGKAARFENHVLIEALLQCGADNGISDNLGLQPLLIAAEQGSIKCVDALIKAGADVNARDGQGRSSLHYAATQGHSPVVKLLVVSGAHVNIGDNQGWHPLHYAAFAARTETCQILIASGALTGAATSHWTTQQSGERKRPQCLRPGDEWTGTPLHLAAMNGMSEIVCTLLASNDTDVMARSDNCEGRRAAMYHHPVPGAGPTALHMALDTGVFNWRTGSILDKGRLESAVLLVDHGAKVDGVADHLCLQDLTKFRNFPTLWNKLRLGITK